MLYSILIKKEQEDSKNR